MLERELLSEERELLSEEVELEAELSDALWELVELVDSEVEIEHPTRRNSAGTSATRARPKPRMRRLNARWVPKEIPRYVSAFEDQRVRACSTRTGWHVRVTPTLRGLLDFPQQLVGSCDPNEHSHVVIHRDPGGDMVARVVELAAVVSDVGEAQPTVGEERPHPEFCRDAERSSDSICAGSGAESLLVLFTAAPRRNASLRM
jgi:hypothetical protein